MHLRGTEFGLVSGMKSKKFLKTWVFLSLFFSLPVSAKLSQDPEISPNADPSALGIGQVDPNLYKKCMEEKDDGNRGSIGSKPGYLLVMLKSFARSVCRPENDTAKTAMVKGSSNVMKDALHGPLKVADIRKSLDGSDTREDRTLVDDYLLLLGLGLRESSGNFNEGRDESANNFSAKTAEAGCFQSSANVKDCVEDSAKVALTDLERSYTGATKQECMSDLTKAAEGFVPDASKSGEDFQTALKTCPALAVEHAAITIRHCKDHYGPLKRDEAKKMEGCKPLFDSMYVQLKGDQSTCTKLYQYGRFAPGGGAVRTAEGVR